MCALEIIELMKLMTTLMKVVNHIIYFNYMLFVLKCCIRENCMYICKPSEDEIALANTPRKELSCNKLKIRYL